MTAPTWPHAPDDEYRRSHPLQREVGRLYRRADRWWTRVVLQHRYGAPPEVAAARTPEEVGISPETWSATRDRLRYAPAPWGILRRVLRRGELSPSDVFVDFGCGAGRIVLEAASRYPFARVIGVDFVPRLTDLASEAVAAARARNRLRAKEVEIVTTDVLDYEVPDDLTFAFLYDPFRGPIFDDVVRKLIASVDRRPRRVRVIYLGPTESERLDATGRFRLVRQGRGLIRRWARSDYLPMYELLPARTPPDPGSEVT